MTENLRIDGYEISIPAGPSEDYEVALRGEAGGVFARLLFRAGASRTDVDRDGEVYTVVFDIRRYHDIVHQLESGRPAFLHVDERGASLRFRDTVEAGQGWPATFD
jgi:hypothetical protein